MRRHAAPCPASDCSDARRATARRDHRVTLTLTLMLTLTLTLTMVEHRRGAPNSEKVLEAHGGGIRAVGEHPVRLAGLADDLRRRRAQECDGSCCSSGSDSLLPAVAGRESSLGRTGAKKRAAHHDRSWRFCRMCPCVHERREHDVWPDIGVHRSHRCT